MLESRAERQNGGAAQRFEIQRRHEPNWTAMQKHETASSNCALRTGAWIGSRAFLLILFNSVGFLLAGREPKLHQKRGGFGSHSQWQDLQETAPTGVPKPEEAERGCVVRDQPRTSGQ
jgi:hypothetical protein